ncbi:MAG: hypothetical protein QM765_46470 [Myxococcales bacterium]
MDDPEALVADLGALPACERTAVLRLLSVASILDGRLTEAERRLIARARAAAGLGPEREATSRLFTAFVGGQGFDAKTVQALGE